MKSIYGIHKLIFINSGTFAYAVFPVDRPLSICGQNNSGKSTAVNALQFLFLADMRDMEFGKHDHLTTRKFYFPGPGSYVLGEVHLEHGTFVIGAAGSGAAAQYNLQHFVYQGSFDPADFRYRTEQGQDAALPLKEMLISLQRRGAPCFRLPPHELRNLLLGMPGDRPLDLTMVPLRGHQERYQEAWVSIFKNLIHMRNVNSQDLKQLLLSIFDIRLVAGDIDFAQEYQRVNADVERLTDEIDTLEKLRSHVESVADKQVDRQMLRGKLKAGYYLLRDRLAKWYDDYEREKARLDSRLQAIEPETRECRSRHQQAAAEMRQTAEEMGGLRQWLDALRQAESEFELVDDLPSLDHDLATLQAERDEVVKSIGVGERASLADLQPEIARREAELARLDTVLQHWDDNLWGALSGRFAEAELQQLFALLNHELLQLPVGGDQGVVIRDQAVLVGELQAILGRIDNGVYRDAGVSVPLAELSSFAAGQFGDRDALARQRLALVERLATLRRDLQAAQAIRELERRRDQLTQDLAAKRRFRDRFAAYLLEREKQPARLARFSQLEEQGAALENSLRALLERERELEKERQQAVAARSVRERQRQKLTTLQERLEPLPAGEADGVRYADPFPEDLETFMEEYLADLDDKRQADERIRLLLDAIAAGGGGLYLRNSEEKSIESLQEAVASLGQRRELLDKAKRTAVAELGNTLKGLRDNYQRLEGEIRAFNRAINKRTVSNLTKVELRLERNHPVMEAIEELVKAGELRLFADDRKASDAAAFLFDWVGSQGRKLNLTHLFELSFAVFSHDGKETVYRNLDRIESHGTTITIKALVNMHLMSHLIEESRLAKIHMPYYIDEAAAIDSRNQEILIDQGLALGFTPVLASVKPQPAATYCVKVDDFDGDGQLVIDESAWIVLEAKPPAPVA